jgi:hypothetical protein
MRRTTKVVVISSWLVLACGGTEAPYKCDDVAAMNEALQACTGAGASPAYCSCLWTYFASRYTCTETPPASAARDSCRECAPKTGTTCSL